MNSIHPNFYGDRVAALPIKVLALVDIYYLAIIEVITKYGAEKGKESDHCWYHKRPLAVEEEVLEHARFITDETGAFWSDEVIRSIKTLIDLPLEYISPAQLVNLIEKKPERLNLEAACSLLSVGALQVNKVVPSGLAKVVRKR